MTDSVRRVDHVARGLAGTFGAGLFLGLAPASAISGWWLVGALPLACAFAALFALSTPDEKPGPVAAALGILGRIAAGIGIAGAFGAYVWPADQKVAAVTVTLVVAAVVLFAPLLPPAAHRVGAVVVLAVLTVVAVACFAIPPEPLAVAPLPGAAGVAEPLGSLPAAALLYVCFVGPAVPDRRARVTVLGVVLVVCLAVAVGLLRQLGGPRLALSHTPLLDGLAAADAVALRGLLAVGVTVACAFALHAVFGEISDALRARMRVEWYSSTLAAGLVALGAVLLEPATALVGAAALLLGQAVVRLLAARRHRA